MFDIDFIPRFVREVESENPCPFCGSTWANLFTKLKSSREYHIFWVSCMDCESKGPWHPKEDKAIERWNWRVADGTEPKGTDTFYICMQAHDERDQTLPQK